MLLGGVQMQVLDQHSEVQVQGLVPPAQLPVWSGTNKSLPAANQEGTALFSVPRDTVGTGTGSGPRGKKKRRWGDLGSN